VDGSTSCFETWSFLSTPGLITYIHLVGIATQTLPVPLGLLKMMLNLQAAVFRGENKLFATVLPRFSVI
jgi:hypothetical protein